MPVIYIVLICLSFVLFGVGFWIDHIEKKVKKIGHTLFRSSTSKVEVLDGEKKSDNYEKPVIISSVLVEENMDSDKKETKKK